MFFFIFFDISSLLLRYITPAIPRSSRLDLSKNILKNIDSYLNFRTLVCRELSSYHVSCRYFGSDQGASNEYSRGSFCLHGVLYCFPGVVEASASAEDTSLLPCSYIKTM